MTKTIKKLMCMVLTVCTLLSLGSMLGITSAAAGEVTVNIVSFMRGAQNDLRVSELLEARVEGYDGNVRDLTYEWTNGLGTYLYVYNDHNMYGINETAGEIEIYNDDVDPSANMAGRTYDTKFSGVGYAWAAVYGASYFDSAKLGTITVTVKDANGNVLATDSHTGTRSGRWGRYTYSGFVNQSLASDLSSVSFGIFEGDSKHIRELFSESSIVHITCEESNVSSASIKSGSDHVALVQNADSTYSLNALSAGTAQISMTVSKGTCKFHPQSSATTTTTVYIYKKPIPTPTTTTITLTNLDDACTYYIDGAKGVRQGDGTVLFTGLTPNTTYTIEAVGHTDGTEPVYAYTQATTLPVYNATVKIYLNGGYDSATSTAYGTLVNIEDIRDTNHDLYIKEENSDEFFQLVNTATGTYTAGVPNGIYYIYRDEDVSSQVGNQQFIINNADNERYLFYYSVEYDANGGMGAPETSYVYEADAAYVSTTVPTKDDYSFEGWKDEDGNVYQPGDLITNDIEKAYKLNAIWRELVDVYVNIDIDHISDDGSGHDNDKGKHDITFTVDARPIGSDDSVDFNELAAKVIDWDGVSTFDVSGYSATNTVNGFEIDKTVYTATAPTFTDMPGEMEYTFTSDKSGYTIKSLTVTEDENNDIIIDAVLVFYPNNFDFTFTVELDEPSKALPDELKPTSVNVKVTAFEDSPYVDGEEVKWVTVTQHHNTYIKVDLDKNGLGTGTFPVWIATNDTNTPYCYRVEVVSYVLPDGTIMPASDVDNAHEYYTTSDERYTAYIEVTNGKDPDTADEDALTGAWFDGSAQQGEVKAIINIEIYDVTLDPNGGKFSDDTTENILLEKQLAVPSLTDYTPTRDGGYTFIGWYYADENGNITDTPAVVGDMLKSDVTLIAKWAEPLTVKGTVSIEGKYILDGNTHIIPEGDREHNALILLRRHDENGYEITIDSYDATVTYGADHIGIGSYEFTGIPNDGSHYHISIISVNHDELYQNELSSSTVVTDYSVYDADHNKAEFNGDNTAIVNVYLEFNPKLFDLEYAIDATAIGEGFRPDNVNTLVLSPGSSTDTNPQNWDVISQMIHGGTPIGQDTALTDGVGNNSYPVWESSPDGVTLYDYAIRLDKYTANGTETAFDHASAPFYVYYNGSARFSALNGQTQLLTATLVPRMYTITFDVNSEGDAITGMDSYLAPDSTHVDTYYWSYGKDITATPVRTGYVFKGWLDENGNTVTEVDASMAENITLTAQWEKFTISYVNNYAYIFGYSDSVMGAEGPLLRCEVSAVIHRLAKQNNSLGGFVYNEGKTPDFSDTAGTWFRSASEYLNFKGALPASDTFVPFTVMTRGEAFKYVCIGLSFTDDTTLTNAEYAELLHNAGFVIGDGSGDLNIDGTFTRAEFCTLFNRIIGRENAFLTDRSGNDITHETYGFTDLTPGTWYYEIMLRATSAYDNDGYVDLSLRGIRNDLDDYAG